MTDPTPEQKMIDDLREFRATEYAGRQDWIKITTEELDVLLGAASERDELGERLIDANDQLGAARITAERRPNCRCTVTPIVVEPTTSMYATGRVADQISVCRYCGDEIRRDTRGEVWRHADGRERGGAAAAMTRSGIHPATPPRRVADNPQA